MPEEFALEQVFRNRAAIDRDERRRFPRAPSMNCPGNQFFAGSLSPTINTEASVPDTFSIVEKTLRI